MKLMQNIPLTTPILFLIFNRPDITEKVFNAIRQAKPSRLYVAADGPRDGHNENATVEETRRVVKSIDWNCEVKTLFREKNLGCKKAVSGGIDWFFQHEEEGIILEDDCLPNQNFFGFCQELLLKYRYDERIMHISGDNFQFGKQRTKYSYYFSRYSHVWGWASWRRAWKHYDREMDHWPKVLEEDQLKAISSDASFMKYWTKIFSAVRSGEIDTWDYQWNFTCWIQNSLAILPHTNLVSNIGFGVNATHTSNNSILSNMATNKISFPLQHPPYIIRNYLADQFTERQQFFKPLWLRVLNKFTKSYML